MSDSGTFDGSAGRIAGDGQGGFTLLELVVALSLLTTVALGFSLTTGAGFRTIAIARQRQIASELLSARIEHLRNIAYDEVALGTQPVHATAATDPDTFVSNDGTTYDVTGHGDDEALVVAPGTGAVLHFEDPVTVSTTVMRIYQYVTWVDDPGVAGAQDYKRVTVVAQFHAPAANGVNQFVRMSSLFTRDGITVGAGASTTTTTTTGPSVTTTTTAPVTTSTTTAGACAGDGAGPTGSFTITASANSEVGYTAATNVGVKLVLSDPCAPISAALSNDGTAYGANVAYDAAGTNVSWSLSTGDGTKTVSARATDGAGNTRQLGSQSLVLDTTKPTVPGALTRSVSCSGTNRSVNLMWGVASDTNLRGYRVYRSTDGVTWQVVYTSATYSYNEMHKKSLDSVRYYVVAYDKAGNESNATNTISLTKNQCS